MPITFHLQKWVTLCAWIVITDSLTNLNSLHNRGCGGAEVVDLRVES